MLFSRLGSTASSSLLPTVLLVIEPLATAGAAPFELQRTYLGTQARDQFGVAVAAAGDVNADGVTDFVVGANVSDRGAPGGGEARLFAGGPPFGASAWLEYAGGVAGENCGAAVAGGGDVDGDGYDDWVVGAPGLGASGELPGRVYFFSGGPGADAVPDRVLEGGVAGGQFGAAVLLGADLDGDGQGDLVIGAPRAGNGEVHIVRGGHGFLTGRQPMVLHAAAADERFGRSLASIPDSDGDRCDDLLVGAPRSSRAATWAGAVLVFRGGAALDTLPDLVLLGQAPGDEFGASSTAGVDVDADGDTDILVGVPLANPGGRVDAGSVYRFRAGKALDAHFEARFDGAASGDRFGSSVAAGFDWNGDGAADLAIGAPGSDAGGADAGSAAVLCGGDALDAVVDAWIAGAAAGAQVGGAAACVGDLRRGGRAAVLFGALGGASTGSAMLYAASQAPVAVTEWRPGPGARLLPAWPNPTRADVQCGLETIVAGHWHVDVFDARGRHVARLFTGLLPPGVQPFAWDGRDSGGRRVAAGVYCIRAVSGAQALAARVTALP